MLEFKNISLITSVITLVLCVILILAPEVIFLIFDVEESNSAFFIGRRAAMLFLGLSVLLWAGRNAPHSESRQAICLGLAVSMFGLAVLGIAEYARGYAGLGIFLAVTTEVALAALYFRVWLRHKD
ncbi:MAG: hypothetical protein CMI09_00865 [Oceanospirillaceae bacterium]|nr:hypothetical protein [Oceanospirillaceae bacterium]|tara:strand:+ start:270 stop:647 length:378 start_codon:yes stop_codon:yes gene_type:complete